MVMAIVYCFEDMGFYSIIYWSLDMQKGFEKFNHSHAKLFRTHTRCNGGGGGGQGSGVETTPLSFSKPFTLGT